MIQWPSGRKHPRGGFVARHLRGAALVAGLVGVAAAGSTTLIEVGVAGLGAGHFPDPAAAFGFSDGLGGITVPGVGQPQPTPAPRATHHAKPTQRVRVVTPAGQAVVIDIPLPLAMPTVPRATTAATPSVTAAHTAVTESAHATKRPHPHPSVWQSTLGEPTYTSAPAPVPTWHPTQPPPKDHHGRHHPKPKPKPTPKPKPKPTPKPPHWPLPWPLPTGVHVHPGPGPVATDGGDGLAGSGTPTVVPIPGKSTSTSPTPSPSRTATPVPTPIVTIIAPGPKPGSSSNPISW